MTTLTSIVRCQIKQIAPNAKDIIVKIEHDHGLYLSKIHMRLPGLVLHAQKKGKTVREAMNSSYEAIAKQVIKFKLKKTVKRKNRIWRWQEPLGPPI